jgi:RNA polymerase sigma factor (sigma-70 family)
LSNLTDKISKLRPKLLSYCKYRIFDKHSAEDIVQDTIFILVKKQNEYDPNKSFSGWAFAICSFQIKAYLSRKSRCPQLVEIEPSINHESSYKKDPCQDHRDPRYLLTNKEEKIEISQKISYVHSVIGKRPSKFLKLYLEGKSRSFIMEKLSMSKVSYYSTKLRLIRKAKSAMECRV